ncbi:UNVERIFIED_CONTAM: integral membrane protein [Williamsia faeni]
MISEKLTIQIFRIVAVAEALTWLALIIAMVVKRVADNEDAIFIPGMTHGVVFVIYIGVALLTAFKLGWNRKIVETKLPKTSRRLRLPVTVWAVAASIPPFGTLVFEIWAKRKGHLDGVEAPSKVAAA